MFSTKSKNYTWKKKESLYPYRIKRTQKIETLQEPTAPNYTPNRLGDIKKIVELKKK